MAHYRKFGRQEGTEWLLMTPQSLWEALRMAWMLWRHPDRVAILVGTPTGWLASHGRAGQPGDRVPVYPAQEKSA